MSNIKEKFKGLFTRKPKKENKEVIVKDEILIRPIVELDPKGVRQENFFDIPDNNHATFVLKPAEKKQRELLLEDCNVCLTTDQISQSSFNRFVGNMIQLLGGTNKGFHIDYKSNQLNVDNDTTVTFFRRTKYDFVSITIISRKVEVEEITYDNFKNAFCAHVPSNDSNQVNQEMYSPLSGELKPYENSSRIANGQEIKDFLGKALAAFTNIQKPQ